MKVEEITDKKCHLKKNVIEFINSAIGVLGPPGAGKSSLCCAYYKIKYNMKNDFFEMSTSDVSFTKGIWVLKESERMKIKENIERDILDVEGFQVDEIKSWKYVMIISFLCTQIIILNRNTRLDDTKKVLNIIKNSLKKMRESNIPKILKTIYLQIDDDEEIPNFDKKLSQIGFSSNSIETVTIKPIYIPSFEKRTLKKYNNNILNVSEYMEDVKKSLESLPSTKNEQSISSFMKYIDNLNMALDGKMNFDAQGIIQDLNDEYDVCYQTWENKKKNELLALDLSEIEDLNETYDDYIGRQNIDFSFQENLNELTFFGSSDEFDQYYKSFGKKKTFTVDKNIYNDIYETKKNNKQIEINKKGTEKQKKLSELEEYFEAQKTNINRYLGTVNFYGDFDSKYKHCNMNISTISELENNKKNLLQKLYDYYDEKVKKKKNDWQNQINRAKYKSRCQAQGELKCEGGHNLNGDSISCGGNCKGKLYWVDGPSHYSICMECQVISKLSSLVCSSCGKRAYCTPKYTDYMP